MQENMCIGNISAVGGMWETKWGKRNFHLMGAQKVSVIGKYAQNFTEKNQDSPASDSLQQTKWGRKPD